ncbi:hypothetical protein Slin15195_G081890 [Septoria linicola]|uniref:Uncharacterized protein n=1 Tax=Septoria linicola TaxID=215465 RepID=A0A9Q9EL97_9PEZI|nr:hypothetical protein Slin15195_G081890 [Septoria linicola]
MSTSITRSPDTLALPTTQPPSQAASARRPSPLRTKAEKAWENILDINSQAIAFLHRHRRQLLIILIAALLIATMYVGIHLGIKIYHVYEHEQEEEVKGMDEEMKLG